MQLWLVRHAVAAEREEFDGPDDERPLTPKGRRRFREFCEWLAGQTAMPPMIATSPLVRAGQTAAILAKAAGLKKSDIITTDLLSPGVDVRQLVQFARAELATAHSTGGQAGESPAGESLALVGHEPDMSHILRELVGGGNVRFGKGFIAAVEFDDTPALGTGRLCWLVGPKLIGPQAPG